MRICVATDVHPASDQRIIKEIRSLKKIGDVLYISPTGEIPEADVEQRYPKIQKMLDKKERDSK